ncbi:MAG: rhomboid family intramembrane serine protease [Lachnospiraceae bacterium]|nr:rhomboid family intramembrane serine protease [Lachnospiraceae bacterium]
MKQRIIDYLNSRGYSVLPSSVEEINILFRINGDLVMSVLMVDCRKAAMDVSYYRALKNQVGRLFEDKGYSQIRVFTFFLANSMMSARELAVSDALSWVVEVPTGRLCIFENQMADYDGLRFGLEQVLQEPGQVTADRRTVGNWFGDFFLRNPAPMTLTLMLINILVFVVVSIFGSTDNVAYMIERGALYEPYVLGYGQYYRLISCMFLHFGIEHLGANMLSLWVFGERVECALGRKKYLFLYLVSGLMASTTSLAFSYFTKTPVVSAGASGAIFGVIGALFAIVMKNRGRFQDLTASRAAFLVGYSVFVGFMGDGIDNAAHIGGLLMGLFLGLTLYQTRKPDEAQ